MTHDEIRLAIYFLTFVAVIGFSIYALKRWARTHGQHLEAGMEPFDPETQTKTAATRARLSAYLPEVFAGWPVKYHTAFIVHTVDDLAEGLDRELVIARTQARLFHRGPIMQEQARTIVALIGD